MRPEWEEVEHRRKRAADGSRTLFVVAGVVGAAFLVWTQLSGDKLERIELPASPQPLERTEPVNDASSGGSAAVPTYRQPRTDSRARQTYVGVYECTVNGQRVVSDKPCGPEAKARVLGVDQPDPREVARQQQQTWAAQQTGPSSSAVRSSNPGLPSAGSGSAGSNEAACAMIDKQIEQIDARMRQGYTSQQGEWYRERLRYLKEQRYTLGCGR